MSEEDAFLDGIAADRADRTRLLVFADWLADRGDPREEFVRLHAKLLDMDGTEPEFAGLSKAWAEWTRGAVLDDRWLDAMCRVCTSADVATYVPHRLYSERAAADVTEYGNFDHIDMNSEPSLVLCRGHARDYARAFAFVAETLLITHWDDPLLAKNALAHSYPITRGEFWNAWRELTGNLREPPLLPELAADNCFLGAQYFTSDWADWGVIAIHREDYFALFWSTSA